MTNTEKLIEALEYTSDTGDVWWSIFESKAEARAILIAAIREEPDEYEIFQVLSIIGTEIDDLEPFYSKKIYYSCLEELKEELRNS